MQRTALVHIGLEKTGSTAVQRWLASHDAVIRSAGIVIPRSLGYPNHTKLVAACLDDGVLDNIKSHHLFVDGGSEQGFRRRIFANLERELRAADAHWHTLLITSELISSRLSSLTELNRLASVLLRHVDRIKFVVFLRRQDQLALSRFSSILRSGYGSFSNIFDDYSPANFLCCPDGRLLSDELFFYDFELILSRFSRLPQCEVDVYFYGVDSPIAVFSKLLGLEGLESANSVQRHNSALSAEAQYIIAQLNQCYPVQFASGMRNEAYRQLQRRIEQEVDGGPRTVSRASAIGFWQGYRAMNDRVVNRYAQREDQCFSDDFSTYPEFIDYGSLPDLVAERLIHYRCLADPIPKSPPLKRRIYYQARRVKTMLKRFSGARPH